MIHLNLLSTFILNGTPDSMPILGLELETFVGMIPNLINFLLLVVVMTWLLYKPVRRILQARADRIEGEMKDAAMSKVAADELKAQYEQKVREIEVERTAILDEARKLANENRDRIVENAKNEAADVKSRAERDIATEKEQIKGAVHQAIIDISTDMAEKLISATIDKNAHDKLFSEAMAELEATSAFKTDSAA